MPYYALHNSPYAFMPFLCLSNPAEQAHRRPLEEKDDDASRVAFLADLADEEN